MEEYWIPLLVDSEEKLQKDVDPRICNTGVQNTIDEGLSPCVDWVQVTFKNFNSTKKVFEILGLNPDMFSELPKGGLGYKKCTAFSNIRIFYDGREDMGVHLQISGTGCREYEHFGAYNWITLFQTIIGAGGQFTRVDLALDDVSKGNRKLFFTVESIARRVSQALLISKFKESDERLKRDIATGKSKGMSIYFGSEKSAIRVRMYDKKQEQGDKTPEDVEQWVRTEIQTRDERAQMVAELIAFSEEETFGTVCKGILKHYLRFVVKGKDKNKSRWETAPFWDKFLGEVQATKLTVAPKVRTIENSVHWIEKNVAPTLAMLHEAFGNDMDAIARIVNKGRANMNNQQKRMIETYHAEIAMIKKKANQQLTD